VSIKKENILSNTKNIYDITRFTHLDYPNHLACIIWFNKCNMRCDYCYNSDIVFAQEGRYSFADVLEFLKSRVSLLDGVVLSGGEATMHNLVPFCKEIKKYGFSIKLDTNGLGVQTIKDLIRLNLIDYIALDYKAPACKFKKITRSSNFDKFSQTLDFLIESDIDFEVRTTVHSELLSEEDINLIIDDLYKRGYKNTYYLQSFLDVDSTISKIKNPSTAIVKSKLKNSLKLGFR